MTNRVLITYATKHGATAEIAEKIRLALRDAFVDSEVLPVENVATLTTYRAVVLGSAVYAGQWRKEAINFLEANEETLAQMPFWLFSSGPTGEGDPAQLLKGWRVPAAQQPIVDRIKPRDITVFHGVLDLSKLNFGEKLIIRGIKAPLGDFRDWDSVTTWAAGIAESLKKEGQQSHPTP
jgi:menaquinone-dependent protoporphyrinogen oxidase